MSGYEKSHVSTTRVDLVTGEETPSGTKCERYELEYDLWDNGTEVLQFVLILRPDHLVQGKKMVKGSRMAWSELERYEAEAWARFFNIFPPSWDDDRR